MTDISKCTGAGCQRKEFCYRYTAPSSQHWQMWFVTPPIDKDGGCEMYWPTQPEDDKCKTTT